ncbi:hypothetical protein V5799_003534 [Amblyomma americanum]|uniref:Secreted protein n=1 Tax=Amblyomma americanum TaxID=6943 RepID=A0AAQ4D8P6_AMBAM
MRTIVLLATLAAAFIAADASSKLLPAVRAGLSLGSSLLRHVAEVKDRLREDVERHLLRQIEQPWLHHNMHAFKVPRWRPVTSPPLRPWDLHHSYHGSLSYQASASGSLPLLHMPYFPRPKPRVILVPCRSPRTHITHILLPCVRIIGDFQQPSGLVLGVTPQFSLTGNVTPSELFTRRQSTTTPPSDDVTATGETTTYTSSEFAGDVVTGGVTFVPSTRAADVTEATTPPEGNVTTEANWQWTEESVTVTPTESEDDATTEASTQVTEEFESTEPEDRRANTVPEDAGRPATTTAGDKTTGQPESTTTHDMYYDAMPTDSDDFNDILKDAQANFGKLVDQ